MTSYFLMSLLQRSPLLLVILAGIVLSIARWKRHPKASSITLIALGVYVIRVFFFTALNYSIGSLRESMHWSYATLNSLFAVLHVVNDMGFAIVLVLLVAAAFANRQEAAPATNS